MEEKWKGEVDIREYWVIKWNFVGNFFYLIKSLFAQKIDRLKVLKGAFRIHSCCFWQQRFSPTIHLAHFNLPAFHTQQHYFLYTHFNIVFLKKIIYLLL